jgi:photosystem II stability/assembly factor-like uncharacterized protein
MDPQRLRKLLAEAVESVDPPPPTRERLLQLAEGPGHTSRRRTVAATAFAVIAVAAAVAAAVLIASYGRHNSAPPATRSPTIAAPPTPTSVVPPASTMPGVVQVVAAAFPAPDHEILFISQCHPCPARTGTYTNWLAITADGGQTWQVTKTGMPLPESGYGAAFADARNGWTQYGYVTHDGGYTWHKVATKLRVDSVGVAGGRVWGLTDSACTSGCASQVLTGSADGDTLRPVPQQPFTSYAAGQFAAVGSDGTYIWAATDQGTRIVATDNGGRTWRTVTPGCAARDAGIVRADSPTSLWLVCAYDKKRPGLPKTGPDTLTHSTDGGRTWTSSPLPRGSLTPYPVSNDVAWGLSGVVYRTTDGGRTWTVGWNPATATPRGTETWTLEALAAQDANTAEIVVSARAHNGTYFIVLRTTDGGRTWLPQVVPTR